MNSAPPDLPGYRFLARLFEDGPVAEYEAEAPGGVRVRVAVLDPGAPSDERRAFTRASAAFALAHPRLARQVGAGEEGGAHWRAMAWPEGELLAARRAGAGARLGEEIAAGLEALHARGFAHGAVDDRHVWLTPGGAVLWPARASGTADSDRAQLAALLSELADVTEIRPVVPGYVLETQLGEGGMGVVWRARHLGLNRAVALKLMKPGPAPEPAVLKRFQREAEATVRAAHPGIVKVLDSGRTASGAPYFAMELVEGRTLAELAAKGPTDEATARRLLSEAADALAAVHAGGFVHRDVKPSNFMLEDRGRLLLLDFGVVRVVDESRLTATGEYLGTPLFMAPEQIQGQPATAASDVYALGITFWELVAGRLPYPDEPLVRLLARIATEGAPSLGTAATVSPELVALVDAMTRMKPAERPTAAQVAARAKGQAPRRAPTRPGLSSGRISCVAPPARKPRWPIAVAALAVAVFAVALFRRPAPPAGYVDAGRASASAAPSAGVVRDLHGMVADTALMLAGAVVPPGPVAVDVKGPDGRVLSFRQDAARPRFRAVVSGLKPETEYRVKVSGLLEWTVKTASAARLATGRNLMAGTGDLQLMANLLEKPSPLAAAGQAVDQALESGDFVLADTLVSGLKGLTPDGKLVDRAAGLARAAASAPLIDALTGSATALSPHAGALLAQAAERAGHARTLELARAALAAPKCAEPDETLAVLVRALPRDGESVTEVARVVEAGSGGPHGPWLDAFLELPADAVRAQVARWGEGAPRLAGIALAARARQDARDELVARAKSGPPELAVLAACALADRGDDDAVARLTGLLDDRHAQLGAVLGLTRAAPAPCADALGAKLAQLARAAADDQTRRAAVLALGELRAFAQRTAVAAALDDESADVRRAAYLALARLGSREGVKDLDRDVNKAGTAPYGAALLGATGTAADTPLFKRLGSEIVLASANPVHPRPARAAAYAWALARQSPALWRAVVPQLDPDDGIVREAGACGLDPTGEMLLPLDLVHRTGVKLKAGEGVVVRLAGELGPNDAPRELVKVGGQLPAPYRPVAVLGDQRVVLGRHATRLTARQDGELVISLVDWPVRATHKELRRVASGVLLLRVVRGGHLAVW